MELEHRESIDQSIAETEKTSEESSDVKSGSRNSISIRITKKPVPATPRGVLAE